MPSAVAATLETLANSRNLAAVPVLEAGLQSPLASIRLGAIRALCRHDSGAAKRALLARLHCFSSEEQEVFCHNVRKMVDVLVEACESEEYQLFENACRGTLWLVEVDAVGALPGQLTPDARGTLAAETLWGMTELASAIGDGRLEDPRRRKGARLVAKIASAVENAMHAVREHGHAIVVHAYLRFARRDSRTLLEVLRDPSHPCFELVRYALTDEDDPLCTKLAASFIGAAHPPKTVIEVISTRTDPAFLAAVGDRAGALPPSELKAAQRLPRPAWLDQAAELLPAVEECVQAGLVRLATSMVEHVDESEPVLTAAMTQGGADAQRTALDLLDKVDAPWADDLIHRALASEAAGARAAAAKLLRSRPLPDNLANLVGSARRRRRGSRVGRPRRFARAQCKAVPRVV